MEEEQGCGGAGREGDGMIDIYGSGIFPEHEEKFRAIEAALGVKLFFWQKTYIVTGMFRQYGATTAEVLRELLQVDAEPLDYSVNLPQSQHEAWYRSFLRGIKQQLDEAGVPTREVFFNPGQKQKYMSNPENRKREMERYREPEARNPWKPPFQEK